MASFDREFFFFRLFIFIWMFKVCQYLAFANCCWENPTQTARKFETQFNTIHASIINHPIMNWEKCLNLITMTLINQLLLGLIKELSSVRYWKLDLIPNLPTVKSSSVMFSLYCYSNKWQYLALPVRENSTHQNGSTHKNKWCWEGEGYEACRLSLSVKPK